MKHLQSPFASTEAVAPARAAAAQVGDHLRRVLATHPSPGRMARRLFDHVDGADPTELATALQAWWHGVVTDPVAFGGLFPSARDNTGLGMMLRSFGHDDLKRELRTVAALQQQWLQQELAFEDPSNSLRSLLAELSMPLTESSQAHERHARLFTLVDRLYAALVEPELVGLVDAVHRQLHRQRIAWPEAYCGGYAYQGLEEIGIQGYKPSERRIESYAIDGLIGPRDRVFDIGANCGLLAAHLARDAERVDGLDINPYLTQIGREAARHLGRTNVELIDGDFATHALDRRYSVVLSLSNHQTTDRRLSMPFAEYVMRCWTLLEPGGRLLFESHNVFGRGRGGPGDDGDLEAKFALLERWFVLERHHMVRSFVPIADIDKLFAVLRRRDDVDPTAVCTLDLDAARRNYEPSA